MSKRMAVVFRLICVRHGETAANKEMRIQGHLDIPLSNTGEAQAKEAGIYLNPIHFTRAYTSDLSRAKATCDHIIKENGNHVDTVKIDPRIRERNFGSVEGMLFKEVLEMAKAAGSSWPSYDPPGSESLADLQQRFVQFFKELCQSTYDRSKAQNKLLEEDCLEEIENTEPFERILLVSHGAGLRQLYNHFEKTLKCEDFPTDPNNHSKISPNTGISEFIIKYSPRRYRMKCVRLHDAIHLDRLNQSQ